MVNSENYSTNTISRIPKELRVTKQASVCKSVYLVKKKIKRFRPSSGKNSSQLKKKTKQNTRRTPNQQNIHKVPHSQRIFPKHMKYVIAKLIAKIYPLFSTMPSDEIATNKSLKYKLFQFSC